MPVKVRVDASAIGRRYGAALREMARLSGFPIAQVLKAEAGSILKTWAGRTKIAKAKQVTIRGRVKAARALGFTQARTPGDVTVNAGLKGPYGRVWVRTKNNKWRMAMGPGFKPVPVRWERGTWTDIEEAVHDFGRVERKMIQQGKRSVGLSRQSVIQIADALGIDLSTVPGTGISPAGIAKARAALASNGAYHKNGTGSSLFVNATERATIRMINTLPYNVSANMDRTLQLVIAGRAGYFERNYRLGVFKTLGGIAAKYPGLSVRP